MSSPSPGASAERRRAASRWRVLEFLRGAPEGCSVQQLADATSLHPNTVRFHLERLEHDGRVSRERSSRRVPGRPPLTYTANPVPDAERDRRNYEPLAGVLAQLVARSITDPASAAIEAGRSWGASRAGDASPTPDAAAAVDELVAALEGLGFAPQARVTDGSTMVLQRHCPFLEVAQANQEIVCSVHLGLMRGILAGQNAPVGVDRLIPFAGPAGCEAYLTATGDEIMSQSTGTS